MDEEILRPFFIFINEIAKYDDLSLELKLKTFKKRSI